MSRQYNPRHFLRHVPNALLRNFFDRRGRLGQVEWSRLEETKITSIFEAWQALLAEERADIEKVFRAIFDMSCEPGIRALVEEGQFHGVDLARALDPLESHYAKAMWAYLYYGAIFEVAAIL